MHKQKQKQHQQSEIQAERSGPSASVDVIPPPSPEEDAANLYKAFKASACDVGGILRILAQRNATHRHQIARHYKMNYDEDLSDRIFSELGMLGNGDLIERVGVDLTLNCSDSFGFSAMDKLLVACLDDKARDEGTNVDVNKADKDAKQLYEDGEKIWGTNNRTFIDIFTKRNRSHLAAVDDAYKKLYGHSLEWAVRKETTRSFKDGLLTLLKCAKNPAKYFAEVLYESMKSLGTSYTTLIRVVMTRAGIDLEDIKKEYDLAYKKSLKDYIRDDTSGGLRTFLLNLVD